MAATHHPFRDLVATIYDAALEPSLWPEVAAGAAKALNAPMPGSGSLTADAAVRSSMRRLGICANRKDKHGAVSA
jgi:hypothetical protein